MNTGNNTTWTRHDLELYHDDALDTPTAERLSEALRESPDLRRRLAQVARADSLAAAALLHPPARHTSLPTYRTSLMGLAAIALLAAVSASLWLARGPRPVRPDPTVRPVAITQSPATSTVVFSFPMPKGMRPAPTTTAAAPTETPKGAAPDAPARTLPADMARYTASLDAALSRGDAAAAAQLLDTPDADLREQGYKRLGAVLRSVTTARRVLGELPVEAQLAACRELALEPRWRTVTCTQLTTLREDPASRRAVDALLDELARSPDLAPLVARVRAARTTGAGTPGDRSI
jgi:hypothetical protein